MNPRRACCVILAVVFTGCASNPVGISRRSPASATLREASRSGLTDEQSIGLALAAADDALPAALQNPAAASPAAQDYNAAMDLVARRMFSGLRRPEAGTVFSGEGRSYSVEWAPIAPGDLHSEGVEKIESARDLKRRQFRELKTRPGLGAPVVATSNPRSTRGNTRRFVPRNGWPVGATLTADFVTKNGHRTALLSLHDPRESTTASIDGRTVPLAANFTAPLIRAYPASSELLSGLRGLFLPDTLQVGDRLTLLEPYRPDRIPVVLVHGLISTPQMWRDVLNELESDPEIGGRFQFWTYYYPTANPISYSAMLLREDLAAAAATYHVNSPIILIGHSMGGILSRLQVTESGDDFWNAAFRARAEELRRKPRVWKVAGPLFYFHPNPQVDRVIFISTPHKGSELSEGFIGRLVASVLRAPLAVTKLVTSILTLEELRTLSYGPFGAGIPTSVRGLSPHNPMLIAMSGKPVHATFHSIIGDRGRGDTPNSSDGVVPYWSSHVDGAASELIVPAYHGAYNAPQTIAELKRILRSDAQSGKKADLQSAGSAPKARLRKR